MKFDFKIDVNTGKTSDGEFIKTLDDTLVDLQCVCGHKCKERIGTIRALKKAPCPRCGKPIKITFTQNITVETNVKKGWLAKLFGG